MRIIECYVENFGKLSAYTHKFTEGLNTTLAENGSGKTTLSVFIKAMFYGLGAERRQSLDENDRKKYFPWQGGRYGGSLTFERGGRVYRIERSFGQKAADDIFRLVDVKTGSGSMDYSENIGIELFDIDAAGFERTVFLSEKNLSGAIANDSISAKLSDLVGTTGDVGAVSGALSRLEERRKYYQKRGNTGEIAQLRTRVSECNSAIDRLVRRRDALDATEARISAIGASIRELERERAVAHGELSRAKAESEGRSFRDQYIKIKDELDGDKAEYLRLEEFFSCGVPTQLEIDEARDAHRDAAALREARRDFESPELTELREFFSDSTDFAEIESIKATLKAERETAAEAAAVESGISFSEATLKDELGGELPTPKSIDGCISAFGGGAPLLGTFCAAALAAVLLIPALLINPIFYAAAAVSALGSLIIAAKSLSAKRRALASLRALGICANGKAELIALKERLTAHLEAKAKAEERLCALRSDVQKYSARISAFTDRFPHGRADHREAVELIEAKFKRYYALIELSRASESSRAATDIRIEHLERRARAFLDRYPTDAPDPFEDVRTRLNAYLYARRTLAKREEDLAEFARLHGISAGALSENAPPLDTVAISERVAELEAKLLSARREQALLESEYTSELSDIERIDELAAERDSVSERLEGSIESLEIIKRTMDMLSEASVAMTSRYIGGTKERFEHYLGLIGEAGEFAMSTEFVLKKLDRGETRAAESYSRGTRDMHSFCLRLALSDSLWGGELPFIMLDDPFSTLDTARLGRAKALIAEIAKEKQVIYFTCSEERMIR